MQKQSKKVKEKHSELKSLLKKDVSLDKKILAKKSKGYGRGR